MEKRRFLLIHGAWHTAKCWDGVVPRLKALGHEVDAIDLPGRSASFPSGWKISIDDHVEAIVSAASKYKDGVTLVCLLYTSPSPRDKRQSRMPSSA